MSENKDVVFNCRKYEQKLLEELGLTDEIIMIYYGYGAELTYEIFYKNNKELMTALPLSGFFDGNSEIAMVYVFKDRVSILAHELRHAHQVIIKKRYRYISIKLYRFLGFFYWAEFDANLYALIFVKKNCPDEFKECLSNFIWRALLTPLTRLVFAPILIIILLISLIFS